MRAGLEVHSSPICSTTTNSIWNIQAGGVLRTAQTGSLSGPCRCSAGSLPWSPISSYTQISGLGSG